MVGLLGLALAIAALVAGFQQWTLWILLVFALVGQALHIMYRPAAYMRSRESGDLHQLLPQTLLAQAVTWSILYGIGWLVGLPFRGD